MTRHKFNHLLHSFLTIGRKTAPPRDTVSWFFPDCVL
jgi:hypothetical protein